MEEPSIQIACSLCAEEFSPDDDFQGQFIECSNCHRRWHPHPDADSQGNTSFCRCGTCHMFQSNLSSFANVTEPEYLAGIGVEFIAERCRTLGKEHNAICMYVKRNVAEIMKHKDYIVDYVRLTELLNKFIDCASAQKEYAELTKQLESSVSVLKSQRYGHSKELNELRSNIETLRNRLNELRKGLMSSSIIENYRAISFGGTSSHANALELIVNGFRYGIAIDNVRPHIYLAFCDSDVDIAIENRDVLVSLYPSIFEVPREFIETFAGGPRESEALTIKLIKKHYKRIRESVTKLDSKFTRVGICSVCEAAPVYIDEHDEYRCSGCQARICKLCFKELNDKHKCNKTDVDEWKLIQADTKACPNCGFRFGHHSRCSAMFCTNCYHGFNYDTLKEIKGWFDNAERTEWARRTGVTNTHIVATFRQLSTDIQIEVARNVGRNMPSPFALLVEGINGLYKNYGGVNAFDSINDELISKTDFGQYKKNAVMILLCEVLKELTLDYIIEILEVCEEMNEGRTKSIAKLMKNEVDLKMNRAVEKLALSIKRLYYYFPVQRIKEIAEIELLLMHSIAAYAIEAASSRIASLNNVFNVDDCSSMSQGLQDAYKSIERSIAQKEESKPIVLEAATSIEAVFEEYKRRFNIQGDVSFQINLRRRYRNIQARDGEAAEHIYEADGHRLTLEEVVENSIRSIDGEVSGKPFRYASFIGTIITGAQQSEPEDAIAPFDDETLTDDELIRRILVHFLTRYDEEYNERTLSFIKIYHRSFRNLRHDNNGYYLIEHYSDVHRLPYNDFATRRIRYRNNAPVSVARLVEEMRAEQAHPQQPR